MIAAKGIFLVDVVKVGKTYGFKISYIDIEEGITERTRSLFYKDDLNNGEGLLQFSKKLTQSLLERMKQGPERAVKQTETDQKRDFNWVVLKTVPRGAEVFDQQGKLIGNTPLEIKGKRWKRQTYRVALEGYRETTHDFLFDRREQATLHLKKISPKYRQSNQQNVKKRVPGKPPFGGMISAISAWSDHFTIGYGFGVSSREIYTDVDDNFALTTFGGVVVEYQFGDNRGIIRPILGFLIPVSIGISVPMITNFDGSYSVGIAPHLGFAGLYYRYNWFLDDQFDFHEIGFTVILTGSSSKKLPEFKGQ